VAGQERRQLKHRFQGGISHFPNKGSAARVAANGHVRTRPAARGPKWDDNRGTWNRTLLAETIWNAFAPTLEVGFAHLPGALGGDASESGERAFHGLHPTASLWWGPMTGWKNFWVACGSDAGFSQGGASAWRLSRWIGSTGDPVGRTSGHGTVRAMRLDNHDALHQRKGWA